MLSSGTFIQQSQGKLRTRMLSKLFEARMILKENKEYWLNVYYNASYLVRIDQGFHMIQQALYVAIEDVSCNESFCAEFILTSK